MNNKYLIGLAVVAAVLVGFGIGHATAPTLGGDFAGGIIPKLDTATTTGGLLGNGYIYPNGSLSNDAANGLTIGGNDQYHGLTAYVSASGTPSAVVTLGAFGTTTSSATSSITVPETQGLSIGAVCSGSSATTTVYVSGCVLSSTNGVTGTAVYAYSNLTGASLAVPTSTRFNLTFDQLPY